MTRRRASGEGGLHYWREKDLWVGRITLPNGKRKAKYNKKQSVVKEWLLTERGKLSHGGYIVSDRMTVKEFMERYLENYAKRSVRATTYDFYEGWINRHIIPEIGSIRLTQLRADHIEQLLTKMAKDGLSNRSVEMVHGILKRSMNKAIKWKLITENPVLLVEPPTVTAEIPKVWTREQVKTFLASLENDRWAAIYYLACTGMRKGEILGLPLKALDVEKGYLMVTQTLQYIPGQGLLFLPPKTEKSKRFIRLPKFILEALKEHLAKRAILSQAPEWKESGLVFTTDIGTPIFPRNMLRHFKGKLALAKLPDIRFHELRHTTATLLFTEKNVHPKLVQELLGHSSIVVTLNRYSHVINPINTVVSDAMDEIVSQ